jgi:hypothetical protein
MTSQLNHPRGEIVSALDVVSEQLATKQLAAIEATVPRGVRRVLRSLPCGSRLQFYSTPKGSLGGLTPIAALSAGKVAEVRRAAEGFVER